MNDAAGLGLKQRTERTSTIAIMKKTEAMIVKKTAIVKKKARMFHDNLPDVLTQSEVRT